MRYKFFWFVLFVFALVMTFNTLLFFIPLLILFLVNLISFKQLFDVDFVLTDKPLSGATYIITNFLALAILAGFLYYNQVLSLIILLNHIVIVIISCLLLVNENLNLEQRKLIDIIAGVICLIILVYLTVAIDWQLGLFSLILSLIYLASLKPLIDFLLTEDKS